MWLYYAMNTYELYTYNMYFGEDSLYLLQAMNVIFSLSMIVGYGLDQGNICMILVTLKQYITLGRIMNLNYALHIYILGFLMRLFDLCFCTNVCGHF